MPHLLISDNCLTGWRDVCSHIIANGDGFNLFLQINQPLLFTAQQTQEVVDSGLFTQDSIQDVVNTIFPSKLYARNNGQPITQFYDLHENIYLRGKTMHRKNRSRWGTYFLRFTKFGGNRVNQLENIIGAINSRTNTQAACYIMHVSSIDYDSNIRTIGGPCLQYVQFAQHNGTVNLTAVYRNHDFLNKALGNYIGLSKLLEFVCNRTGKQMGNILCHSIHYYLGQKRRVSQCLENLTW